MISKFLLPYSCKKWGIFLFPSGSIVWVATQMGVLSKLFYAIEYGSLNGYRYSNPIDVYTTANRIVLAISFLAALAGIFFLCFSKEQREDEYLSKLRLESFQLSALVQLLFFTGSFLFMLLSKTEPDGDGGLSIFFLTAVLLFWMFYVLRFNYVAHWKNRFSKNSA